MDKDLLFNECFELTCVVGVGWLKHASETIAPRRRQTYQRALEATGRTHVPLLMLDRAKLLAGAPKALAVLAEHVSFQAAPSSPHAAQGLLYDLLSHARDYDLYDQFLAEGTETEELSDLYMVQGAVYAEDREKYRVELRQAAAEWRRLVTVQATEDWFRAMRKSHRWRVECRSWAPYVRHCLFESPRSRLRANAPGDRFHFVPLDADDRTRDWESLVRDYMRANPQPKKQTVQEAIALASRSSSMPTLPYPERLLNRRYMVLAALDMSAGPAPVMAGYLVCSASRSPDISTMKTISAELKDETLRAFAELRRKRERGCAAGTCGFDLFSIDAIHVSLPYRGTPNLAKVLALMGVEIARQSHRLLGFTLLMSLSLAAATRSMLTGLGFQYYNATNALRWIIMAFKDYHNSVVPVGAQSQYPGESYGTPKNKLSLESLTTEFSRWRSKYNRQGKMREVESILLQFRLPQDTADVWTRLPKLITLMELRLRENDKTEDPGDAVKRTLLGTEDPDDTFLFLDKNTDDDALFSASDKYAEEYRSGAAYVGKRLETATAEEAVEADDRVIVEPVPVKRVARPPEDVPDEEDLLLYSMWLHAVT